MYTERSSVSKYCKVPPDLKLPNQTDSAIDLKPFQAQKRKKFNQPSVCHHPSQVVNMVVVLVDDIAPALPMSFSKT